eukprot:42193-Chlamydomonas_euryale.AAC.2
MGVGGPDPCRDGVAWRQALPTCRCGYASGTLLCVLPCRDGYALVTLLRVPQPTAQELMQTAVVHGPRSPKITRPNKAAQLVPPRTATYRHVPAPARS